MTRPMQVFTEGMLAPEPWVWGAACAETDPDVMFPDPGASPAPAKRVCAKCDVVAECLEYALRTDQRFGVWGSTTAKERKRLRELREGAA